MARDSKGRFIQEAAATAKPAKDGKGTAAAKAALEKRADEAAGAFGKSLADYNDNWVKIEDASFERSRAAKPYDPPKGQQGK